MQKLSEEVIHSNPWWDYKHDRYTLPNGQPGDYYYGEDSGSALIIPILDNGKLLLVVQNRYLLDKRSVEFPCGGLKKDEQPSEAATRELLEETGHASSDLIKIGSFDALNGLFKDTTHIFVARELTKTGEPQLDGTEEIEILFRRPDEFEDMIQRGEIWDGQTLASWAVARDKILK